ncbi:MAG: response regulator transcription factor [Candidatus Pelethousia sp.]|nr:response regulator transcription factor [Candidatus Pelethousia sp.]
MIYYVEDDVNIRELVVYTLGKSGLSSLGFANGAEFCQALESHAPELVLLDIMLPGEDGIALLRRLRQDVRTASIPVMMITAKGSEYDTVVGLDSGADDYLAKPFGMMELVSRVRALLRRAGQGAQRRTLSCGAVTLDHDRHEVRVSDQPVSLTLKEYDLLHFLVRNPGMVFTREKLLSDVWGYDYEGGTRTVDVHVQTLRQKLGESAKIIQTVRGVGYRAGEGRT